MKTLAFILILLGPITIITSEVTHSEYRKYNTYEIVDKHSEAKRNSRNCGVASYYSRRFVNRKTASGERYRPNLYTAASRHLKFGTRVVVSNPRNGNQVIVRINDRGPAKGTGRIIDLSEGAFKELAHPNKGIVKVCLRNIK